MELISHNGNERCLIRPEEVIYINTISKIKEWLIILHFKNGTKQTLEYHDHLEYSKSFSRIVAIFLDLPKE
tara:strand:+ start:168 stop:380 length:213 start_codon:yes stop_codon:yes gene_type:complete